MGQSNMIYPSQMIELQMDQQGQRYHPKPFVPYRTVTNFPPPNIHTVLPAPRNPSNFDVNIPEHRDSSLLYGMIQYNGAQHHHSSSNPDLVLSTASNHHNPYTTPLGTCVFPIPLNHGPHDQFHFSSNYGFIGGSTDSSERNSHFIDDARDSYKRKNAEGIPGNCQYFNALSGCSSSPAPNARRLESDGRMDVASFAVSEYEGNDTSSIAEDGHYRSVRNIPSDVRLDSMLVHSNHLIPGNYLNQAFQTATTPWLDQQFKTNGGDIGTLTWNQAPALPYLHGSINGNCVAAGNMGLQGYQLTACNRSSTSFLHPPPIPQGHPNYHYAPPPPPMQRDAAEAGLRYVGPFPPTGLRIHRPNRGLEANPRQHNLPHLRILPEDGVAILEIPGYHEVGDSIDHHRDMRLDIDHMTYEELLELGEQIGSVGSGLSEETILSNLRARTFLSATCSKLQKIDLCIICQTDYKAEEKIGSLDCGHEYHMDCIQKWLLVKNSCPVCKSSVLTTERKDL